MRLVVGLLGAVLLVATVVNAGRGLVAPRTKASWLPTVLWLFWRSVLRRRPGARHRYTTLDRTLEWLAPLTLVSQLLAWLFSLFVAYAALAYGVTPGLRWPAALRQAGSSLFSLGFAVPRGPETTVIDILAAASGPLLIALQIAYLPAMYGAYNRRETQVTLLRALAGEPSWGPELLARQHLIAAQSQFPWVYENWARLAADVGETHANYPILLSFRSPQPYRSWVVSLLAVMDAAAMQLACAPRSAPSEARLVLRAGFLALRDIADARSIPYDPDPIPDEAIALTFAEFRDGVAWACAAGFTPERPAEDAWPHFRGWRVNYEALAYTIAARVDAVPAPWSGPRDWPADPIYPQRPQHREPGPE
ncbi:hypothetical protein [Dactylosporangium darangshiense]|uniref:Integral membrane protein n=1 Tax=Dactylosporangium darangshiense TaxID=579108 RepID=A0ABP8DNX4_9ACTN